MSALEHHHAVCAICQCILHEHTSLILPCNHRLHPQCMLDYLAAPRWFNIQTAVVTQSNIVESQYAAVPPITSTASQCAPSVPTIKPCDAEMGCTGTLLPSAQLNCSYMSTDTSPLQCLLPPPSHTPNPKEVHACKNGVAVEKEHDGAEKEHDDADSCKKESIHASLASTHTPLRDLVRLFDAPSCPYCRRAWSWTTHHAPRHQAGI